MTEKVHPEAVQEIVGAIVSAALARCDALGITRAEFLTAMLTEQRLHPAVSVSHLLTLTFSRLLEGSQ